MSGRAILHDAAAGRWLCFSEPVEVLAAARLEEVLPHLRRAEERVAAEGLWAAGFVAYEAAPAFDPALPAHRGDELPLLWLGLYRPPRAVDLEERAPAAAYRVGEWRAAVGWGKYARAIAAIKEEIAHGRTYQVNYTLRLRAPFAGDPWGLFLDLVAAQRCSYGAYLDLGGTVLCSASPELAFDLQGEVLTSRPMKGTHPRGRTPAEDEAARQALQRSEKDRAENVMIVDMVRNDLGRVAAAGSVAVPRLFDVEPYPTVLQMTSTVTARSAAPVAEIFQALFPPASITGAPKASTMGIIRRLEGEPRGVYTGSIGFLAPGRRAQFNVAIRTAVVRRRAGRAEYGVGGGIVWDSEARAEYEESQVKARVLDRRPPPFRLLETLLWEPGKGYFLLQRHLDRLAASGGYFGFPMALEVVREALEGAVPGDAARPHKVRLLLSREGGVAVEAEALTDEGGRRPLRLAFARLPVSSQDVFLFHKTTHRAVYDEALASRPGCDEVLLFNERGEVTEACRANLVVKLGGRLVTPPVGCGLLAGTFRGVLLERGWVEERVLQREDVERAEGLYLVSSVRRWRRATLSTPQRATAAPAAVPPPPP